MHVKQPFPPPAGAVPFDGQYSSLSGRPTLGNSAAKDVGTAAGTVAAGDLAAPLASPTFTGTPAAPTAAAGTSTTQLATTAFVRQELATTYLGVGSYIFAMATSGATTGGGTVDAAANALRLADASGSISGAVSSGTWRCQGLNNGGTSPTLWQRIS